MHRCQRQPWSMYNVFMLKRSLYSIVVQDLASSTSCNTAHSTQPGNPVLSATAGRYYVRHAYNLAAAQPRSNQQSIPSLSISGAQSSEDNTYSSALPIRYQPSLTAKMPRNDGLTPRPSLDHTLKHWAIWRVANPAAVQPTPCVARLYHSIPIPIPVAAPPSPKNMLTG